MLTIKLFNLYLKRYWFCFLLSFLYTLILIILYFNLLKNFDKSSASSVIPIMFINIIKNFDLFFLGFVIFPICLRILKNNDFYKNYLLKTKKHFRENFVIFAYFLSLLLTIVLIKQIIYFSIEYSFKDFFRFLYFGISEMHKEIPTGNFELSLFGNMHIAISSLFLGYLISFLPIRKLFLYYAIIIIFFFLTTIFVTFLGLFTFFKLTPKQSTDVFSRQTLNIIFVIKEFLLFTPLLAGITLQQVAFYFGYSFDGFLNFGFGEERNIGLKGSYALTPGLPIWIIVSFFVYMLLMILFCFLNKSTIVKFKNKINRCIFINQTKRKKIK